jgi:hypothetical protein
VSAEIAFLAEVAACAFDLVPFLDEDGAEAVAVIEQHRDLVARGWVVSGE